MKTIKTFRELTPAFNLMISFLLIFGFFGCSKDEAPPPIVKATPKEEVKLSDAKAITSFVFLLTNNPIEVNVVATIDEENKTITAALPPGTDITGLLPEVKTSELAIVDRDTAQDFTEPLEYEVTAEDGSTTIYTVTITALLTQRQILQIILDANPGNTLDWNLNATANLGDLEGVTLNTEDEIIELKINAKAISTLAPEIGQLTKLTNLILYSNQLTSIPPEIGQLSNLVFLDLSENQLASIPPEIGQLTKLTNLILYSNQLTSIPPEIGQLTNLKLLVLHTNQLTSLPPEISQLTKLTLLSLKYNQLISLPPEIWQLTKLTSLNLNGTQLTTLPPEIGQLTNLTALHLHNNQLSSLPPEIGFLSKLDIFSIGSNDLITIPQAICNLSELHFGVLRMSMDDNVTCSTTSQKDALISIYSANPGNTLGWGVDNYPEVSFHDNGNPKVITMNNKNLTRIPESISSLSSLETFNVNNNNLESLPAVLGSINSLGAITAASNQLSTVPAELGQLQNLALLSITNNLLTSIPQEVCNLQISNGGILTILADPGEGCN